MVLKITQATLHEDHGEKEGPKASRQLELRRGKSLSRGSGNPGKERVSLKNNDLTSTVLTVGSRHCCRQSGALTLKS